MDLWVGLVVSPVEDAGVKLGQGVVVVCGGGRGAQQLLGGVVVPRGRGQRVGVGGAVDLAHHQGGNPRWGGGLGGLEVRLRRE